MKFRKVSIKVPTLELQPLARNSVNRSAKIAVKSGEKVKEFGQFVRIEVQKAEVAERTMAGSKAAALYADRTLEWGREQHARVGQHLPETEDVKAWARTNAEKLGLGKTRKSSSLEDLEKVLIGIMLAIRQTSDRRARIVVNGVVGKLGGVAAVGGTSGLVTSFGIASTGTAIASLSGAALTTAKLYWIGSLVGLGVAGGGILLAAGGVGAGVATGALVNKMMFGKRRSEDDFRDHERAILVACATVITSVKEQCESGHEPSPAHMKLVAEQALMPIVDQINQHWDSASLEKCGKAECRPFTNLAPLHRHKLDRCRKKLELIAASAMKVGN